MISAILLVLLMQNARTVAAAPIADAPDGKKLFERICADCHGVGMVVEQRHTEDEWRTLVDSMISRGAQGSDEEFTAIVTYLAKNYGKAK